MNPRKPVLSLLLPWLLASMALGFAAKAETQLVWNSPDEWEGINVEIHAPYQAYPGDNITMGVEVGATIDLNDIYLTIRIHGSKSEGYDNWTTFVCILSGENLPAQNILNQSLPMSIPSDVSSGPVYGHIYCLWNIIAPVPKGYSMEDSFEVTYLKNKGFEQLQKAYSELNATYNSLLANQTKLNNYKSELDSTRNLMYILVATTIVSAVTAFVLLVRRPKRPWV